MGFFDNLKRTVTSELGRNANKLVKGAVNEAVKGVKGISGKTGTARKEVKFSFAALPTTVEELKALPEASLNTPFKTAALAIAVLTNYEKDPEGTYAMLNVLKGPEPLSNMEKQHLQDRLRGKIYKVFSFFAGATVENDYTPDAPYKISVFENPYSFAEENWAVMWVKSAGADDVRPIKLRKKPSTGEWFINEIQCLSDIRTPKSLDKWA